METIFGKIKKVLGFSKQESSDFPYEFYNQNEKVQDTPSNLYNDLLRFEPQQYHPFDNTPDIFGRHQPEDDMEDVMKNLEDKMMGNMFGIMGFMFGSMAPGAFGHSRGFYTEPEEEGFHGQTESQHVNPRDQLLKYEEPSSPRDTLLKKEDTDIDGQDLSTLLRQHPTRSNVHEGSLLMPEASHNTFQFSSTRIIRNPDGTVEESRTYRDHTGREETTTTTRVASDGEGVSRRGWFFF